MVTIEQAIIAKLEKQGKKFEILVDPEAAYSMKQGTSVSASRMLAVNHVYHDSKKGELASEADIEKAFSTLDPEKIAEEIVRKGELQITTDFKRRKIEEKKRQVATIISRSAYDPKTRMPHPIGRILNAMEQAKFPVSPFVVAEKQAGEAVERIKEVLPLSMKEVNVYINIPAEYSGRVFGKIREFGKTKQKRWAADGSLEIEMSITPAMKEKLLSLLNSESKGSATMREK